MSENHTPEPWRIGKRGEVVADTNEGLFIKGSYEEDNLHYYGGYLIAESIVPSNARRIVACVNACEGIPLDKLQCIHDAAVLRENLDNCRIAYGMERTERERLEAENERLKGIVEGVDHCGICGAPLVGQPTIEDSGDAGTCCAEHYGVDHE